MSVSASVSVGADGNEAVVGGDLLKTQFARAERRKKMRALLLVLPLFLFVLVTFLAPVSYMLNRSVDNTLVSDNLPRTLPLLAEWQEQSGDLPDEAVYRALLQDLQEGARTKIVTRLGQRLNYEIPGVASVFRKTARKLKKLDVASVADAREYFVGVNKKWGEIGLWRGIKFYSAAQTPGYYYAALDYKFDAAGNEMAKKTSDKRIYGKLFLRTIALSLLITLMTFLMGYPVAFLLSSLPPKTGNLLMILVLLPFWTSLLVRTTAWIVLLQTEGVINDLLVYAGFIPDDGRLEIIHNGIGTVVAMTHILLPFMILPLYSVMKTIKPSYMRAARSMGANAFLAFRRVYFPQTVPGIGAGAILVFILSIGYYITPELVGGASGTFISNRIAYHISSSLNWGLASALGFLLLVLVLALYWLYDRIVGIDNMKLG